MSIKEDLQSALNELTPETWIRGSYFRGVNSCVCFCAHGAVQKQVNPAVKKLGVYAIDRAAAAAAAAAADARAAARVDDVGHLGAAGLADALTLLRRFWDQRPDWVSNASPNYGSLDAHYLLGMVGLTANFNDDPKTTLEMVWEKFCLAIKLAEDLGI